MRKSRGTRKGRSVDPGARVGALLLGVWLTIAPFALDYQHADASLRATLNDVVVGAAVVALALLSLVGRARSGDRARGGG